MDQKNRPFHRIDRKSSIETEPKTLDIGQIQIAREAALDVMSTKTIEEALNIFTQGLEPVVTNARQKGELMEESSEETMDSSENKLRFVGLREVVSAPF